MVRDHLQGDFNIPTGDAPGEKDALLAAKAIAEGVLVTNIDGKGRGVVTRRQFSPGDTLFEEAPYAAVVAYNVLEHVCSGEFTILAQATGSTCSGCKSIRCASCSLQINLVYLQFCTVSGEAHVYFDCMYSARSPSE